MPNIALQLITFSYCSLLCTVEYYCCLACCEVNWIVNVIDHGQRSLIKFIFILINLFESVIAVVAVVCLLVCRTILAVKLMRENFFFVWLEDGKLKVFLSEN